MTNATELREWMYVRPWLYDEQAAAVYDDARISVIEAGTKTGKTYGCIVWLWEQAWCGPRAANHWWVAPYQGQARIAYERMKRYHPPQLYKYNDTLCTITIKWNGATVWFKTAEKPDALYGEDVYSAVVDESTRCRAESWTAVRTTLTATRGPIRIIGNVKGRKNWAYRLARRAESGAGGYAYHKITADDAVRSGILDADEIQQARFDIADESIFRELYYAEATEQGANPFGGDLVIESCLLDPTLAGEPVVWGWDLARKVDWTVGIAMDALGRVCRFERWQKPWTEAEEEIVAAVGDRYALVDQTGVGDVVVDHLQRASIESGGRFDGFTFTSSSKQGLMEGLAREIKHRAIWFPPGDVEQELKDFEYEHTRTGVKYSAPEGLHDDCVDALALCVRAWRSDEWQAAEVF